MGGNGRVEGGPLSDGPVSRSLSEAGISTGFKIIAELSVTSVYIMARVGIIIEKFTRTQS